MKSFIIGLLLMGVLVLGYVVRVQNTTIIQQKSLIIKMFLEQQFPPACVEPDVNRN